MQNKKCSKCGGEVVKYITYEKTVKKFFIEDGKRIRDFDFGDEDGTFIEQDNIFSCVECEWEYSDQENCQLDDFPKK